MYIYIIYKPVRLASELEREKREIHDTVRSRYVYMCVCIEREREKYVCVCTRDTRQGARSIYLCI